MVGAEIEERRGGTVSASTASISPCDKAVVSPPPGSPCIGAEATAPAGYVTKLRGIISTGILCL